MVVALIFSVYTLSPWGQIYGPSHLLLNSHGETLFTSACSYTRSFTYKMHSLAFFILCGLLLWALGSCCSFVWFVIFFFLSLLSCRCRSRLLGCLLRYASSVLPSITSIPLKFWSYRSSFFFPHFFSISLSIVLEISPPKKDNLLHNGLILVKLSQY